VPGLKFWPRVADTGLARVLWEQLALHASSLPVTLGDQRRSEVPHWEHRRHSAGLGSTPRAARSRQAAACSRSSTPRDPSSPAQSGLLRVLGCRHEDMIGQSCWNAAPHDTQRPVRQGGARVRAGGVRELIGRHRHADRQLGAGGCGAAAPTGEHWYDWPKDVTEHPK